MRTGPGSQFTIANVMILVAAVALVMGIVLTPGFAPILSVVVIPATIVGVGIYVLSRHLVDLAYGPRCPICKARGMERRGLVSFADRFFLCRKCGTRCRRGLFGGGLYAWKDAAGPEFAAFYDKPRDDDPWNLPPGLEDGDELGLFSKTHLDLVRNKRRRSPENPNGPGLP